MRQENLCIVGTGYIGLVTGACFALLGHRVICVDNNKNKIEKLKKGIIPIYEPGLAEVVKKSVKAGRLFFVSSIKEALHYQGKACNVVFIAVGTPPKKDGSADLSQVESVARETAQNMTQYTVLVEKSTVPVGTGEWLEKITAKYNKNKTPFSICSNPEFLREGTGVNDFLKPDRIIVGTSDKKAAKIMKSVYAPFKSPMLFTDVKSSELIKHSANAFLAAKISFINGIANVCGKTGANVEDVARGMGMDTRIGHSFLKSGIGYGGFCLPKDVDAFYHISKSFGYDFVMLKEIQNINYQQKMWAVKQARKFLGKLKGKTISVLGLAFKANTDDMRFAPSIDIINALKKEGARVRAYDPIAADNAKQVLSDITFCKTARECLKGAHCILLLTEWDEFKKINFKDVLKIIKNPVLIDGRNLYDPQKIRALGYKYISVGRP